MKIHLKATALITAACISMLLFPTYLSQPAYAADSIKNIWIVTDEIKVPAKDGHGKLEVYRWDPGTIVLHQGDRVMLHIYGVKGKSHPFELEGYNVKGIAMQGQVTKIMFTADKAGTFPFICLTHRDKEHDGPMIAYFEVLPK
ncbi:cupredoxin domain-containing protein [Fodinisporobacter ferrooxydans]|uniref:Cupredoxin domain-containing protein n=1 Tax=Fodinisporobacter ferrooxydans TaxID=2901836 RepID=A0ABY4CPT2_9BACL|nr:cupredoxin domain-containing protein [Alicyclobacillaceae bacterium MYW30-H2]